LEAESPRLRGPLVCPVVRARWQIKASCQECARETGNILKQEVKERLEVGLT
jgi:hypothetical protein